MAQEKGEDGDETFQVGWADIFNGDWPKCIAIDLG
jgi:hypothetical protein